jgi:hypothetical protein
MQQQWIARLDKEMEWTTLETLIADLTRVLQPPQRPAPRRQGRQRAAPRDDAAAKKRLQWLYRKNRSKAMREVRQEESPVCDVRPDTVVDHFQQVFEERLKDLPPLPDGVQLPTTQAHDESLAAPITREEILAKLKKTTNTAPGPDGIRYQDLKRKDPNAFILAALYQACQHHRKIPTAWKEARTILLHKKGDRADLNNRRPIALSSCLYKTYTGILADRLGCWARRTGAVSKCQKGFMPAEGCLEHNFLVQQCLDDVKQSGRELVVTWLDLRNAFGSAPHDALLRLLEHHGPTLGIQ